MNWTPAAGINDQLNFVPPALTDTMWYRRWVTDSLCTLPVLDSVNAVATIAVLPPLDASFALTDTLCGGMDSIDLSLTAVGYSAAASTFSGTPSITLSGDSLWLAATDGPGTYTIMHVLNNGLCTDTATQTVTIWAAALQRLIFRIRAVHLAIRSSCPISLIQPRAPEGQCRFLRQRCM